MSNLKIEKNFITKNYHHFFAFCILSIYYFLSIIIFKEIIVTPHDNLDILTVYDHVIGNIFRGELDAASYFLSGTIKWFYIENLFHPINLMHLVLDAKHYYFTQEIIQKILSYFAFYILAKSVSKNKFNNSLSAVVYSSIINVEKLFGLGLVMAPYFLYLLVKKKEFKPKHFFIIIIIGLSTSLARDYLALCLVIPISVLINQSIKNIKEIINYFIIITLSILISSIPVILSLVDIGETHRLSHSLLNFFSTKGFQDFLPTPLIFLYFFIISFSILSKKKNQVLLAFFLILIFTYSLYINPFLKNLISLNFFNFLEGFNFQRIDRIIPLIICVLLNYNLNVLNRIYLKKFIYFLSISTIIIIQAYIPTKEAGKKLLQNNLKKNKYEEVKKKINNRNNYIEITKFLIDKNNYQKQNFSFNLNSSNTFDNYYRFEVYSFIKTIVKQDRVMSVGLDPMVAVMNNIKVIDGYHTIYPMKYKKKFREIIADELELNIDLKNYYDNWGNRVYAFYNNSDKLLLNFKAAKGIGANYIISAFPIENKNLVSICNNCLNNKDIFLYKIL